MAFVTIYDGTSYVYVEVTEEFAKEYVEMDHREWLIELKETRRHQSLDKSMAHGWDIADPHIDIPLEIERKELRNLLRTALKLLTNKQRIIFLRYVLQNHSFRKIGEDLGLHKNTVLEHYKAALKKLKKFFKKYPFKI